MQSPENYWDDIDRYCGEILAGLPAYRYGIRGLSIEGAEYTWPAAREQGAMASLTATTVRALGVSSTSRALALTEESGVIYRLRFNPDRRIVETDIDTESRTAYERAKKLYARNRFGGKTGISLPTEEDYATLHAELGRGAAYRSFDTGGNA